MNNLLIKLIRKLDTWYFQRDKINKKKLKMYLNKYHNNSYCERNEKVKSISIVMPCYNHANYLSTALNSITKQTRLPDEVICIDDCSTDVTFEVLSNFYNNYSKEINIIIKRNKKNIGQSASINLGVSHANSELIMILNDDDYLMHDAIEHTLDIFNLEKDIYLLGSKSIYIYSEEHFRNLKKFTFDLTESNKYLIRKIMPENVFNFIDGREIDMMHSSCSFLKIAWEVVGGYIPNRKKRVILFSDRDFQLRVNSIFPIAILENAALAFWRINSSVDQGIFS